MSMNAVCHFNGTGQFHWGTGECEETHRAAPCIHGWWIKGAL